MTAYLTTNEVMARYRFRDPRAARALMRRAGCVKRGGALLVQLAALDALDGRERIVDSSFKPINDPSVTRPRRTRTPKSDTPSKLEPGWWQDAG